MFANVSRLQEVANFVTASFSAKIKKLAKEKREFTTFFAFLETAVMGSAKLCLRCLLL